MAKVYVEAVKTGTYPVGTYRAEGEKFYVDKKGDMGKWMKEVRQSVKTEKTPPETPES